MHKKIQPVISYAARHLDEDVSLASLARQAGLSTFHLQRAFSTIAGESPKQFTLRLRLGRAAAILLTTNESVLDIALACGFQSHEVFIRAFRPRFGLAPLAYRQRGFATASTPQHATLIDQTGRCIGLYHIAQKSRKPMTYSIDTREIAPQPVLFMRRRIKRSEIAATIAEILPAIFLYAQRNGLAFAGPPYARYPEASLGFVTIEPGMPIAAPASIDDPNILVDILPGGPAAFTTHYGPYENLHDAYATLEEWIKAQGLTPNGAPWESYITDPGDYPDPKDWRTDVFWPLQS